MSKQDWTPRLMDLPPEEAFLKLKGHDWWDFMHERAVGLGYEEFHRWVLRLAKPWWRRKKIIEMMAWNDHNSTFNLEYDDILRTHRFMEGDKVTAELVVDVLEQMMQ